MKRKKRLDPGWWAEHRERFARTDRLLSERIAHHRARVAAARPGWTPPATDEEWAAYNEARIRAAGSSREDPTSSA